MDPIIIISLICIFISILASGFFAGSETAITGASPAKIHKLKVEGNKRAIIVHKLRQEKEQLISALLIGNSLCNVISSAITTSLTISLYGADAVVYTTALIAVLIIVFAEILPKAYAFDNPEKVSLAAAPILNLFVKILYPLLRILELIVDKMMKIIGLKSNNINKKLSTEELRGAIDLHHHEGEVVKHARDMLGGVLDLSATDVKEIMVHRKNMITLNCDLPNHEILAQVLKSHHTRIPLWKEKADNIVGILHVRDFLSELAKNNGIVDRIDLRKIISKPWFIPETTSLSEQLHEFRKKRSHFALVIDEYGDLMGLVTLEDILEEIVGQIDDEYDVVHESIIETGDDYVIVSGIMTIRDLNREFDWNLPDEHASTIAGLIMHVSEKIPELGEIFTFFGFDFEILGKEKNQITSVKIKKLSEQ